MHTTFSSQVTQFAVDHDDAPIFHAVYLILTFLAAALLNVGAFAVLVSAHIVLDFVKYRHVHRRSLRKTFDSTLRENLLDLFFLTVALCFALYAHGSGEVIAISGIARIDETIIRSVGLILPRLEVLWHSLGVFANVRVHLLQVRGWSGPWRRGETLCLAGFLCALLLVVFSPFFMNPADVSIIFREQLVPWRL